jgi:hypothetical protein
VGLRPYHEEAITISRRWGGFMPRIDRAYLLKKKSCFLALGSASPSGTFLPPSLQCLLYLCAGDPVNLPPQLAYFTQCYGGGGGGETNNLNTTGTDTGPYLRIVIERYDKCMTRRETLVIVGCFRSTEKRPLSHMQSKRGGEG